MIYVNALDNIFSALQNKRLFDRFGFNLPRRPIAEGQTKTVTCFEKWEFDCTCSDWVNKKTGETLTGYSLPPQLAHLLEYGIDICRE